MSSIVVAPSSRLSSRINTLICRTSWMPAKFVSEFPPRALDQHFSTTKFRLQPS
uniref:Uncharacterized protein n=1 Tax=Hyaloperonospora arabidopsidis (strain Emoy2) TaxID=559515 RepID=M4BZS5_HYAAE